MNYIIEEGIPVPGVKTVRRRKYPLNQLRVGESFLIPMEEYDKKKHNNVSSAIIVYKTMHAPEKKFKTRRVAEGVRVWRTA